MAVCHIWGARTGAFQAGVGIRVPSRSFSGRSRPRAQRGPTSQSQTKSQSNSTKRANVAITKSNSKSKSARRLSDGAWGSVVLGGKNATGPYNSGRSIKFRQDHQIQAGCFMNTFKTYLFVWCVEHDSARGAFACAWRILCVVDNYSLVIE